MDEPKTVDQLRAAIAKEIAKKKPDAALVQKLAAELSRHDVGSIAFSVNATIVRRLGRELVSARETALAELVKNAYDADASHVSVILSRLDTPGGRMVIKDDGEGMTFDQVRDGFLRIASDEKEREPTSIRYKRRRAGQKGIGRFAVERLGKRLTLITSTDQAPDAIELSIDWDNFETSGDLTAVRSPVKRVPKTFAKGTQLIIDGLREGWSTTSLQEAQSYLDDLLEPDFFDAPRQKKKDQLPEESEKDPGFSVTFSVMQGVTPEPVPAHERSLVLAALAVVDAQIDDTGNWSIAVEAKLYDRTWKYDLSQVPDDEKKDWTFTELKNVRLQAAYYIWEDEIVESLGLKGKRKAVSQRAGIRVYRNGFRVSPYGNPGNDWLDLDKHEGRRKILVGFGNKNWLGHLKIRDPKNELIVETSSREGLVQNKFYNELRTFAKNALTYCAVVIGRHRGRKVFASDQGEFGQTKVEKARSKIQRLTKEIQDLIATRHSNISSYAKEAQTEATISEVRTELETLLKDTTELSGELSVLRVFASVGMSVVMFSHEVKGVLVAMLSQIDVLLADRDTSRKTAEKLKTLREHLMRLQHHTGFYESTGSAAAARERIYTDMLATASSFVENFQVQAARRGIQLSFEGDVLLPSRQVAIHEAEFSAILINLYTNAIKAIDRRPALTNRKIKIRHQRVGQKDSIEFMDNGVGIPKENRDKVFEPFFTTTAVRTSVQLDSPELYGAGLGLTITRDSVKSAGGSINIVVPPPSGYATCIKLELPHVQNEKET